MAYNSVKICAGKRLRTGISSGSCAALAAAAAACELLAQKTGRSFAASLLSPQAGSICIQLPSGEELSRPYQLQELSSATATCQVIKDAGDDPDITDQMPVLAKVNLDSATLEIKGGLGVGRVTKPGLDQAVGEAAINSAPRQQIGAALERVKQFFSYAGSFSVEISLPLGAQLAPRTFNPKLGIVGGLSILGTSGLVEPMSNQALIDSLALELKQLAALGHKELLITLGNYGERFARENLALQAPAAVSCSNFVGVSLQLAAELGFERIFLLGHIGKMVKLGLGRLNLHSAEGDGRLEMLLRVALEAGASLDLLKQINQQVSCDAVLDLLAAQQLRAVAMQFLGERIEACLRHCLPADIDLAWLLFSHSCQDPGVLCESNNASIFRQRWHRGGQS